MMTGRLLAKSEGWSGSGGRVVGRLVTEAAIFAYVPAFISRIDAAGSPSPVPAIGVRRPTRL